MASINSYSIDGNIEVGEPVTTAGAQVKRSKSSSANIKIKDALL